MENLGFWNVAQRDPQHLAIVTQNGERITNGELLSRANQLVHGLRAQGFKAGDTIATVLKN
ncbi:MAG: AMP-binding protein, partial [Myxococcota bacterium]|nr:AMP-binding protein [Myxococcota bacterium]